MATIDEGVYWCARDLRRKLPISWGNHHFILLVTSRENFNRLKLPYREEGGVCFSTLAVDGKLKYIPLVKRE